MGVSNKKILSLSKYNVCIRTFNDNLVVNVTYPEKWQIISPSNESVKVMRDDKDVNTYYYIAPVDPSDECLTNVISTIDETIQYNHELQEKIELLNAKIAELSTIFAERDIDELRTMEFTFKGKKKKANKPKKTDKVKEDTVAEEKEDGETDMDRMIAESIKKKNMMEGAVEQ